MKKTTTVPRRFRHNHRWSDQVQVGDVIRSDDLADGQALFVVEEATEQSVGPLSLNGYWHVTARRLLPDGSYNPKGHRVHFTQDCPIARDNIDRVLVVGKMRRIVRFV